MSVKMYLLFNNNNPVTLCDCEGMATDHAEKRLYFGPSAGGREKADEQDRGGPPPNLQLPASRPPPPPPEEAICVLKTLLKILPEESREEKEVIQQLARVHEESGDPDRAKADQSLQLVEELS